MSSVPVRLPAARTQPAVRPRSGRRALSPSPSTSSMRDNLRPVLLVSGYLAVLAATEILVTYLAPYLGPILYGAVLLLLLLHVALCWDRSLRYLPFTLAFAATAGLVLSFLGPTGVPGLYRYLALGIPALAAAFVTLCILGLPGTVIAFLRPRIAALRTQVVSLWPGVVSLQARVTSLWPRVSSLQSRVASLWSRVASFRARVASLWSRVASPWGYIVSFRPQVTSLRAQVASLWSRVVSLRAQVASLWSRVSSLRAHIATLRACIASLRPYATSPRVLVVFLRMRVFALRSRMVAFRLLVISLQLIVLALAGLVGLLAVGIGDAQAAAVSPGEQRWAISAGQSSGLSAVAAFPREASPLELGEIVARYVTYRPGSNESQTRPRLGLRPPRATTRRSRSDPSDTVFPDDADEIRGHVAPWHRLGSRAREVYSQLAASSTPPALPNEGHPQCPGIDYQNTYPRGVCTWYAKEKRKDLPRFSGDYGMAMYWPRAAQLCGFRVDQEPAAGAVIIFPPGANGAYWGGHAAYVEEVGDDYVLISECNVSHNPLWSLEPYWWEGGYPCAFRRISFDWLDPRVQYIHGR